MLNLARRAFPAILVVLGVACGDEPAASAPDARAAEDAAFADAARSTLKGYAKVGRASYDESVRLAKLMEKAIEDITKAPSPELLEGARIAWRRARDAYGRAEAFRFSGGPLDQDAALMTRIEETGLVGVDVSALESLVDLFDVNTDVTSYAIIAAARERRVPMGWHAIEAMLWTPGRQPTDFAAQDPTSREARRGRLTAKLARILIEDLELVANQWDAMRTNSFAQKLVGGSLDAGFKSALGGVSSFAKKEVVERKLGTVLAGGAEVSDASDSTRADVAANLLGIEGLLHAREGRVTAPSFVELLRRDDPALADTLVKRLVDARAAVDRCPELGDVAKDPAKRAPAEAARDAQVAVAAALDDVLRHYSLTPLTP